MENAKKVDISTKIRHYFLFSKLQLRSNIPTRSERLSPLLSCFPYHVSNAETQHSAQITGCLCQ